MSRSRAMASATLVSARDDDGLGRHHAAGGVLAIRQQRPQLRLVVVVEFGQQHLAVGDAHLLQEVRGIVGLHLLDDRNGVVAVELADDGHLFGLGKLFEHVGQAAGIEGCGELGAALVRQRPQRRRRIGLVHRAQPGEVAGDGVGHEGRCHHRPGMHGRGPGDAAGCRPRRPRR